VAKSAQAKSAPGFLERQFQLTANGTDVRTEVVAGITTFLTMAYIIFVNPGIITSAVPDMPFQAVMIGTIVAAAFATILMAFIANYPVALAPGMGLNAYFAFTVIGAMGVPWQTALGAVFISGVVFILLTLTRVREAIIDAVPASLKGAIGAGIGFFIAFIGLKNGGIVVSDPATFVALGDFSEPGTLLAVIGVIVTGALMAMKVKGSILFGIIATAVIGWIMGLAPMPKGIVQVPTFSDWAPVFGKLDIMGALRLGFFEIVFAFLFVDLFDTVGTLIGVAKQGNFLDKNGRLPRAKDALLADSIGTVGGAIFGTPTVTSYIESAAGVAVGGKTGLTALVVAGCFLLSLFFTPVIEAIATAGTSVASSPVTAAALILVGSLMVRAVLDVKWDDPTEAIPAFIAMIAMPLTYSIATGISLAFVLFPLFKLVSGKGKEVHWILWVLAVVFVFRFIFLSAA